MMMAHETVDDSCIRFIPVREFDNSALRTAKDIFDDYKKRGVIKNGSFDDTEWTLTNETQNIGLTLLTFEGGAKNKAMSWIGCTYTQYMAYVKAYVVFNLGKTSLLTLQDLTRMFNRLAVATREEALNMKEYWMHISTLLQLIPGGNEQRDTVIEEMEEKMEQRKWSKREGNQRQLADFRSYLRFHEVLANFWQSADKEQKLFYFPLYFWWNLTAILPLRPMEFLLTPRDCLRVNGGEQILTVRRTKLKGGCERITYRVSDDYELREYVIKGHLADEIRWYIKSTEKMKKASLDTLLLQAPHFSYLNRKVYPTNRYYTYGTLNTCRKYFYREVVSIHEENVGNLNLGDTRHLAMTNLILSGGSPVICRELAGHAHIDISSHYYTNISNLVQCATIERYRKTKSGEAKIHGSSKYSVSLPPNTRPVSGGRCASPFYLNGNIEDCLKVSGYDGHIGDCRRCIHYLPDNPGVLVEFYDANAAKEQVDADSKYLISMIELVRKGLGYTEDIGTALLRLQHSGNHYGKCLLEQYLRNGLVGEDLT